MKIKKIISNIIIKIVVGRYKRKGVIIGTNTFISRKVFIDTHSGATVTIGNNCYITRNTIILNHTDTHVGGPLRLYKKYGADRISKDVVIGNNVFVGVGSVILPGIKIGDNAIIGAMSLVNKDVPKNTVFAGVPAKYICNINDMLKKDFKDFDVDTWNKEVGEKV